MSVCPALLIAPGGRRARSAQQPVLPPLPPTCAAAQVSAIRQSFVSEFQRGPARCQRAASELSVPPEKLSRESGQTPTH